MPLDSLEVRWFFDGGLDAAGPRVADWFTHQWRALGRAGEGPPAWPDTWRDDRYLLLPGVDDMGIKTREGRFEIKGRLADFGPWDFAAGVRGRVQRWAKWSYDLGSGTGVERVFAAPGDGAGGSVRVDKKRLLLPVALSVAGEDTTAPSPPVVGVELVRIRLAGEVAETHWSIGFEAMPYSPPLHRPFADLVTRVTACWPAAPLGMEASLSYPGWLAEMAPG